MIKPFNFFISALVISGCIFSAIAQDTDDSNNTNDKPEKIAAFNGLVKTLAKENMQRKKQNSDPNQKLAATDIFLPYCADVFGLSCMLSKLDNGRLEDFNELCMLQFDTSMGSIKRCYLLLAPETEGEDNALRQVMQKKSWDVFNFVKNNDKIFSNYRRFSEILNDLYLTLPTDRQKELVSYVNHNYPALSKKVTTLSDIDNIYERNDFDRKTLQQFYFIANYSLSDLGFAQEIMMLANQNDIDLVRNLIVSQINYKMQMIDVLVAADPLLKSDQYYQMIIKSPTKTKNSTTISREKVIEIAQKAIDGKINYDKSMEPEIEQKEDIIYVTFPNRLANGLLGSNYSGKVLIGAKKLNVIQILAAP